MSTPDTLDSILDRLLRSYAHEPISHAECKAVEAERERLRAQFITKLLRAAAGAVPEGWKLVPIEPTDEMVDAGFQPIGIPPAHNDIERAWGAMLAASPLPQVREQAALPCACGLSKEACRVTRCCDAALTQGTSQAAAPAVVEDGLTTQPSASENGGKTGSPPGLLQDDCRGLSKWLSSRPDALRRVREACAEIEAGITQEKTNG